MNDSRSSYNSAAFTEAIIVIVYIVSLALACIMFSQGGLEGLIGLAIGGLIAFFRGASDKQMGRRILLGSLAGLWCGLIVGGLFHTVIARLLTRLI